MTLVLNMHNVSRSFESPGGSVSILKDVCLKVISGTAIAIRGPSGCGKSTLLYLAGTLDQPSSGTLEILGENPWSLSKSRLAAFRNQHIGFIFQDHQLLPQCSVLENVLLPSLAGFGTDGDIRERAINLIDRVGLSHRGQSPPRETFRRRTPACCCLPRVAESSISATGR